MTVGGKRELVIAVHIDGISISVALVDRSGELVAERARGAVQQSPTPTRRGGEGILTETIHLIERARIQAPAGRFPIGIGIGSEGVISPSGRVLSAPTHYSGYAGTDLADVVSRHTRLPVSASNDVHTYALGEAWRGAAAGAQTAIFVGVGSGVYGSVLTQGRPWYGAHNVAGQIGHLASPGALGLTCSCGKPNHVEAIASGPGIRDEYERRSGHRLPTGQAVIFAAERGDPQATAVVSHCAAALGVAAGDLANALDCEIVVVGGPIPEAGATWWTPMESAFRATLIPELWELPVRRATLGHDAALVGAARMAWDISTGPLTAAGPVHRPTR
ncbi:Glucokinase [Austwickia sp. TVS 96-490-7B]|uniref:ROK family protein n=1 Tax=Austwickia sp. TVS 96-490-7B TaxID=2830843 RepID=UPI001C58978E|nr:ROK family protein [Austwickia sp. TVS 96-490-7B]MBW3085193.1 Glucokinase [Austwickia sp. TVS 96-490-7B]